MLEAILRAAMLTLPIHADGAEPEPRAYGGLQVLIADDDPATLERLRLSLTCMPRISSVHEARNFAELKSVIQSQKPDIAFIDVQLGDESAFEMLAKLGSPLPLLIFHSQSGDRAVEAFDLAAVDFLLKPAGFDRLSRALDRAERHLWSKLSRDRFAELELRMNGMLGTADRASSQRRYVWRKHAGELLQLAVDEVEWFQAAGDYVIAHTSNESHFLNESVTKLHERLASEEVVRVHRSSIVNLQHVQRLRRRRPRGYSVVLKSGRQIAVGPKYETEVLGTLNAGRWR